MDIAELKGKIRDIKDFPSEGVLFKDITTLLGDARAFSEATGLLGNLVDGLGVDKVVAIESRGFILGAVLADRLKVGFVPVRKPGKLPAPVSKVSYALEYGQDSLEIHKDALAPGERILVVDDVLATGGTARAVGELVQGLGGRLQAFAFLIELTALEGRERLKGHDVRSLLSY